MPSVSSQVEATYRPLFASVLALVQSLLSIEPFQLWISSVSPPAGPYCALQVRCPVERVNIGRILNSVYRFYFRILLQGGKCLAHKYYGGKWKESAQCLRKHVDLGGSGGMLPQELLILQTPEIASESI